MFKKTVLLTAALMGILLAPAAVWSKAKEITMLVVPRTPDCIRVAYDMASYNPVLLVTYRMAGDELQIHAWNGKSWVEVSLEDYASGSFFSTPPGHVIIVQSPEDPAPETLIPDGTWCDSGNLLNSTEPRAMIHLLGRYFDLSYNKWKDLTWRYKMPMEEINPGLVNIPWWHFRGEDLYRKNVQRNLAADLDKWYLIDITPPVIEPVEMEEDPEEIPAVEIPADESVMEETNTVSEVTAPAADTEKEAPEDTEEMKPAIDTSSTNAIIAELNAAAEKAKTNATEAATAEPAAVKEADPFSETEIPAAEVIEE